MATHIDLDNKAPRLGYHYGLSAFEAELRVREKPLTAPYNRAKVESQKKLAQAERLAHLDRALAKAQGNAKAIKALQRRRELVASRSANGINYFEGSDT